RGDTINEQGVDNRESAPHVERPTAAEEAGIDERANGLAQVLDVVALTEDVEQEPDFPDAPGVVAGRHGVGVAERCACAESSAASWHGVCAPLSRLSAIVGGLAAISKRVVALDLTRGRFGYAGMVRLGLRPRSAGD